MKTEQEVLAKILALEEENNRSLAVISLIENQNEINQEEMSRLLETQNNIKNNRAEITTLRWVID
ncbi:hypothetical protein HUW51_00345 (plasmid) [Adhaeribacter swui]|uniref:Uncharacterized protein n=1 Tax=Adhaeribacter swui TaxID=2086471 RepID=A0A7G7G255_9BACT|nr:hypothetical protein [Adhaeribacter swui]QNF31239.1 hypothetical protein HUW51_00345 [Adhaeribacter swui]